MSKQVELTAAEADKVTTFLVAARALPRTIALEVEDGVLSVWKRAPSPDFGTRKVQVATLKKKSLDTWE